MPLPAKHERFVLEYLKDNNGTQAAIRAGYAMNSARVHASRLLANAAIAVAIAERQTEVAEKIEITAELVLRHWYEIATADPRELVSYVYDACRYCHGKDHEYHWIDYREYAAAVTEAYNLEALELPSDAGGYGFDPREGPHDDCRACFGKGVQRAVITDTRRLSGPARRLYAGVKQTKDGIQVLMRDQDKALENLARYLGMLKDGASALQVNIGLGLASFYGNNEAPAAIGDGRAE